MSASVARLSSPSSLASINKLKELWDDEEVSYPDALRIFARAASIVQSLPQYDVIGMDALVERLRDELRMIHQRTDGLDSINKLSARIRVSRSYLAKFRDGGMVCMNIMNRIAQAFQITYMIENYQDPKLDMIR